MNPYIEIIRPVNCLMIVFAVLLSMYMGYTATATPFIYIDAFLAAAATFLVFSAGNIINDFFDVEVDKINRPFRPIPSNRISKNKAVYLAVLLFLGGISFAALINVYAFIIASINAILVFIYSKVKEKTPYGSVFVGYFVASAFLFGAVVANINSVKVVGVLAVLAFLGNMAREITKDIEDVRGDKYRKTTLATYYNDRVAGAIAAILLFIAIGVSVLPMAYMNSSYAYIILVADTLFAYSAYRLLNNPHEHATEMQKFEKAAMFIALVAFFAGVL